MMSFWIHITGGMPCVHLHPEIREVRIGAVCYSPLPLYGAVISCGVVALGHCDSFPTEWWPLLQNMVAGTESCLLSFLLLPPSLQTPWTAAQAGGHSSLYTL